MTTDGTDGTGEARTAREAALADQLDALRRGLEAEPPLAPDDVRRRIDAIADAFLHLQEGAGLGPAEPGPDRA